MEIKSFVATISEFFLMDRQEEPNFDLTRKKYVIPKYQREYKWTQEKVHTLIADINNRDKFLGNLILNKVSDYYEIVDGQQRITTILLILLALFNKNKLPTGAALSEEQRDLLRYIYKNHSPVLENETIGNYIDLQANEIVLSIAEDVDIYYQKNTFENLYRIILGDLEQIDDLMSFQKKVLDCQVLVLIGDTHRRQNESIEEIFLDINFKSQLLDVADIFKGYCFKNYTATYHEELKEQWATIRKYMKKFEKIGYVDTETCAYLYHYLLSRPETYRIPSNLSYNGKHYLEGKGHTRTKALLVDMENYGKHITDFIENLSKDTYFFEDICSDAARYCTDTVNHQRMKQMLKTIILNTNVQYYKLPLFMVLHYLLEHEELKMAFSYESLKKFITNYYTYSFLFANDKRNKNKTAIDQTIFNHLYQIDSTSEAENVIRGVLAATKELRRAYLSEYKQFSTFSDEKAFALYSLIDNYSPADNYLNLLYSMPAFNKEHLIAHGNTSLNVTWIESGNEFTFSLNELLGKPNGKTYRAKQYRALSANYIILPVGLNESLGHKDIVQKVIDIKEYYLHEGTSLPKHIEVFVSHIESLGEYTTLVALKGQGKTQNDIKNAYKQFVNVYFSEESQRILYEGLERALKDAFVTQA